jgi:hypothetical protein
MPQTDHSHKLSSWARQVHIPEGSARAGSRQLHRSALIQLAQLSLYGDHPGYVDCYPSTVAEQLSACLQITLGTAQRLLSSLARLELVVIGRRPVTRTYACRIDSPHTCTCGSEPLGTAATATAGNR